LRITDACACVRSFPTPGVSSDVILSEAKVKRLVLFLDVILSAAKDLDMQPSGRCIGADASAFRRRIEILRRCAPQDDRWRGLPGMTVLEGQA
jgi:hypothetical protein